jgi:Xaa-Pro aminopeptidase
VFDYGARRRRLWERMDAEDVGVLFLAPSADLEYLTGVERHVPNFGEVSYAHGWVTGAFVRRGAEPVFVFPRMFATFDLAELPEGEVLIVAETDDAAAVFERLARRLAGSGAVAVGDRVWSETTMNIGRALGYDRLRTGSHLVNELRRVKEPAEIEAMQRAIAAAEQAMAAVAPLVRPGVTMAELAEEVEHELRRAGSRCPSFTTHLFTGFEPEALDSGSETSRQPVVDGMSVMFDFGAVVGGYCSDFGRTVYVGEPPTDVVEAYETLLAAHEAGRAAAVPGAPAAEVDAACRRPIEEAGLGEFFRHRMGHGIGKDVHERPFLSTEDATPLEAGMTFTDEPSIMIPGRFGVRIEDVIVCAEGGARVLNGYDPGLAANAARSS